MTSTRIQLVAALVACTSCTAPRASSADGAPAHPVTVVGATAAPPLAAVSVDLQTVAAPPAGLAIDGDISEWGAPPAGNVVTVALEARGLVIAGRLARAITSVDIELGFTPPKLPPMGLRVPGGVDPLRCDVHATRVDRPDWPQACQAAMTTHEDFVARYEARFRARYVLGPSGIARGDEAGGGELKWSAPTGDMRTFEARIPPEALPEVAEAPVRRAKVGAVVSLQDGRGTRATATLEASPSVSFEPDAATRERLFAESAGRLRSPPLSYLPGRGMKAHVVVYANGDDPRPLEVQEIDLVGPLHRIDQVDVASVHAGARVLAMFRQGTLQQVFRDLVLASGAGPVARAGELHVPQWTATRTPRGCTSLQPQIMRFPPDNALTNLADPPPSADAPGGDCWTPGDTSADAVGDTFQVTELRLDSKTGARVVRVNTWRYVAARNRYVRSSEEQNP